MGRYVQSVYKMDGGQRVRKIGWPVVLEWGVFSTVYGDLGAPTATPTPLPPPPSPTLMMCMPLCWVGLVI